MILKTKRNYKLYYFSELKPITKGRNIDGYENIRDLFRLKNKTKKLKTK